MTDTVSTDRPRRQRFRCGALAPMSDDPTTVLTDAVVDVVDGTIDFVGPATDAPDPATDMATTNIDGLLLPGFVNAHAHTPMVLLRGTGEGLPTGVWLTTVMWPREARLSADDVGAAMAVGAAELLAGGVTTSNEMYFYPEAMAAAASAAGLRTLIGVPMIESASLGGVSGSIAEQLTAIDDIRGRWADAAITEITVAPHSGYALSDRALSEIGAYVASRESSNGRRLAVHTHLNEQRDESAADTERTGLTAAEYLDRAGLLTTRTIAAHGVWVSPADIDLLAERGTSVVHCPASNGRHASGIAPVAAMRAAGITVGLGTDGPASHDRLDVFEEMRTAIRYARIAGSDAALGGVAEALYLATAGAADALGRGDLGRIAVGCRADFFELDVSAVGFAPVLDASELIGRAVWAGTPSAVRRVWVDGRQVVADGECTTVDVAAAELTARAQRLSTP